MGLRGPSPSRSRRARSRTRRPETADSLEESTTADESTVGLLVSERCQHLIREFRGYKEDHIGKASSEDHALDSLQYACMELAPLGSSDGRPSRNDQRDSSRSGSLVLWAKCEVRVGCHCPYAGFYASRAGCSRSCSRAVIASSISVWVASVGASSAWSPVRFSLSSTDPAKRAPLGQ